MNSAMQGLIAAPHTPFAANGQLNLDAVERQASHFASAGLPGVFIGGTTGEALSLTCDERIRLTDRWISVGRDLGLKVIVHVGSNCLAEAQALAEHAQKDKADGIAAFAPCFFRPDSIDLLIDYCRAVAHSAPATDFFFYNIPSMTCVDLWMPEFLEKGAKQIPTLRGLKFSHGDIVQESECVRLAGGRFHILHGLDESLLAALSIGVRAAVGCTYNFAAPLYQSLIAAFDAGDLERARQLQERSVTIVRLLCEFGFLPSSKAVMELIGIDCGPVRAPLRPISANDKRSLKQRLERIGFFDWLR
jgi:N-acetylneuraminate lyase